MIRNFKTLSKTLVFVLILGIVLLNVATVNMYYTAITLGILFVSFVVMGMLFTPIFLLVPLVEWVLKKLNIHNQNQIITITMTLLTIIAFAFQVKIIHDYEFEYLPLWLNFEGAFIIVPTLVILLSFIPTYFYQRGSKSYTSFDLFGFFYTSNVLLIGVLYAPYMFGNFVNVI